MDIANFNKAFKDVYDFMADQMKINLGAKVKKKYIEHLGRMASLKM